MRDTYLLASILFIAVLALIVTSALVIPTSSMDSKEDTQKISWHNWKVQDTRTLGRTDKHADPILFVQSDGTSPYHLLARDSDGSSMDLYRSQDMRTWTLQKENAIPALGNTGVIGPDGTYYVYYSARSQTGLLTASSLTGPWKDHGLIVQKSDPGAFYDTETDTFHLFYETKPVSGNPSGNAIGHSTSPNGVNSWIHHGDIIDISETGYHTGDPEIIKVGNRYHLFADKTHQHPKYRVVHYSSMALNGPWTQGRKFALTPDNTTWAKYGVGDATIRYVNGTFYAYFESWATNNTNYHVGFATSKGPYSQALYEIADRDYQETNRGRYVIVENNSTAE